MIYKLQVSMDWVFLAVLQVIFQPALSALFTVETEQTAYKSEFGGNVVMGCRFDHKPSEGLDNLIVTWRWINSGSERDVIQIDNGVERAGSPKYHSRVKVLKDELNNGWAKLQISSLTINDSGTYQCLVHTKEGADYKTLSLSVAAPYKTVTTRIEKASEADQVLLTCQSEGYPESSVLWQDGHMQTHRANTTVVSTPDQLFQITSQIRISSSEESNYTCHFTNDGTATTFHIPDDIPLPRVKNDALMIVLSIVVIMLLVTAGVLAYRRRKGFSSLSTRNLLAERHSSPAAASPQIEQENENEATAFTEGSVRESPSFSPSGQWDLFLLWKKAATHISSHANSSWTEGSFDMSTAALGW